MKALLLILSLVTITAANDLGTNTDLMRNLDLEAKTAERVLHIIEYPDSLLIPNYSDKIYTLKAYEVKLMMISNLILGESLETIVIGHNKKVSTYIYTDNSKLTLIYHNGIYTYYAQ
jgi:hypothetical protein